MRCKCCDSLLNEWESKSRDSKDRSKFVDLCNVCRYYSNPYTWMEDEEIIHKEDLHIDFD